MENHDPPPLYSYADLVRETGIPRGRLRVWYQRGKLPHADYRVGLAPAWTLETILPWLEEHRPGPP